MIPRFDDPERMFIFFCAARAGANHPQAEKLEILTVMAAALAADEDLARQKVETLISARRYLWRGVLALVVDEFSTPGGGEPPKEFEDAICHLSRLIDGARRNGSFLIDLLNRTKERPEAL